MRMLKWANIELKGKRAVVLGRSRIVGMPAALLLAAKGADATNTVAHSRTKEVEEVCKEADVLIAAVGRPDMVKASWVKPERLLLMSGSTELRIQRENEAPAGDVDPEVAEVAAWLSPVPGGVGPMTIAMLMENTVRAAELVHDA